MDNGVLFSELKCHGKPLNECELALQCNENSYRLYVNRDTEYNTFWALAVSFVSCYAGNENIWGAEGLTVEPLFNVTAYSDGIRHLEFNREAGDMAGYIYYPNMQGLIALFQKIREIELETCRDCEAEI